MVVMDVGVPIVLAGTEAPAAAAVAEAVSVGGLGKSVHANLRESAFVYAVEAALYTKHSSCMFGNQKKTGFTVYGSHILLHFKHNSHEASFRCFSFNSK